jgi:hypothetical protein
MIGPFLLLENLTFSAKNLFFFYLLNTSFPNLFFSSFISYHYTINPMILLIIDYFYFILFILKITGTYIWWTHNCALMACFFFFLPYFVSLYLDYYANFYFFSSTPSSLFLPVSSPQLAIYKHPWLRFMRFSWTLFNGFSWAFFGVSKALVGRFIFLFFSLLSFLFPFFSILGFG